MIETDERVRELLETLVPRSVEQPEWEGVPARLETLEDPGPIGLHAQQECGA